MTGTTVALGHPPVAASAAEPSRSSSAGLGNWLNRRAAPAAAILAAAAGLLVAAVCVASNAADRFVLPAHVALLVTELFLLAHVFRARRELDPALVVILGVTVLSAAILGALPTYFAALGQSAIFHRSVFAIVLLCAVSLPLLSSAVFHFAGGTPSAEDAGRYPLVAFPAVVLLAAYVGLLAALLVRGVPELS